MKSVTMSKVLSVAAVSSLLMLGGTAQADGCLMSGMAQAPMTGTYKGEANLPLMNSADPRMSQEMARIESALRAGQISPYQAGKLMRAQWELAQFQRGFMGKGQEVSQGSSCAVNQDMVATLVPIVSKMAKNGIQTASTVMGALAREVGQIILEKEQADEMPDFY